MFARRIATTAARTQARGFHATPTPMAEVRAARGRRSNAASIFHANYGPLFSQKLELLRQADRKHD